MIRRVDDLLSPTRGYMADVRVGGGIPGLSTEGFGRVVAQAAAWYPIDRLTQLAFRAEAGAVLASSRDGVPSILLFRTGGDTTVRGYEYQSLGVRLGDAIVGGRYYAIAQRRGDPLDQRDLGHCGVRRRGQRRGFDPRLGVRASATAWAQDCERRSARSGSTSRMARRPASGGCISPSG